jgi:hypothetical protein
MPTGLSRRAPTCNVYLNGLKVDFLAPITVSRHINFARPDTAVLNHSSWLSKVRRGNWLDGMEIRDWAYDNKLIQIEIAGIGDGGAPVQVHYGRLAAAEPAIVPRGEMIGAVSRFDEHMFGQNIGVFTVPLEYNADQTNALPDLERGVPNAFVPITFNPIVDGQRFPNRVPVIKQSYYTIPQALPRSSAKIDALLSAGSVAYWTLSEAVDFVCFFWNLFQTHVENPTIDALQSVMGGKGPELFNLTIEPTDSLPEALNKLLIPFGYVWHVELASLNRRYIQVTRRHTSDLARVLYMQSFGSVTDLAQSRVSEMRLTYDVVDSSASNIAIVPEPPIVEGTFELVPAWDPDHDRLNHDAFAEEDVDKEYSRVWRDWVLNEHGEYDQWMVTRKAKAGNTGLSYGDFDFAEFINTIFPAGDDDEDQKKPKEWSPTFLGVPKWRHRFDRLLTTKLDGSIVGDEYGGVWIEFWTKDNAAAEAGPKGDGWQSIEALMPNCTANVLQNECGVRIQCSSKAMQIIRKVPYSYSDDGQDNWESNFKLRVTATIQFDTPYITHARLPNAIGQVNQSHLADSKVAYISKGNDFRYRFVHALSRFYQDNEYASVAVNDELRSIAYAKEIYANWATAACSGEFVIPGLDLLDTQQVLGQSVSRLQGRDIGFQTNPEGMSPERYPTIAGISYDIQRQQTKLHLETYRRHA